jgi:glycerophosphoryl diester phosphodiesterase
MAHVLVIAHRGASAYAPEHTLAAYDRALEMGADYIEQDLQMTADGELVVLHDDTLDRTTRGAGCRGRVIERTLAEVKRCDAGSWFAERNPARARPEFAGERVPTLHEVFERYAGRARFYIETKNPEEAPGMEEALVALLRRHALLPQALPSSDGREVPSRPPEDGRGDVPGTSAARVDAFAAATTAAGHPSLIGTTSPPAVLLQSFGARSLQLLRVLAPGVPRVHLIRSGVARSRLVRRLDAIAGDAHAIGPSYQSIDARVVAAAHEHGLAVHPYTVNDEAAMRRLIDAGVDGMFTDDPALLLRLRAERR